MEDPPLTLSHQSKLASEVYRHVDPLNFYDNFLKEGIRPDGRGLYSYRKISIKNLLESTSNFNKYRSSSVHKSPSDLNTNTNQSTSLHNINLLTISNKNVLLSSIYLSCGNSRYHCKVTGDLINTQSNNWVLSSKELETIFNVDVTVPKHVVGEIYDINGPCVNISHLVSDLLESVLNSSKVIPKERFLLYDSYLKQGDNASDTVSKDRLYNYFKKYKLRWKLNVEIMCDEYDGNLLDMCFLCCSHSLLHSKIPFVLLHPNGTTFNPILFDQLLDNNTQTTQESVCSNQDLVSLIELNKDLLCLQLNKLGGTPSDTSVMIRSLVEKGHTGIDFKYIPLTITFCKCLHYFLLDPTMEDEQNGVNYSIYALKRWKNSNEPGDHQDRKNDLLLQPLNLMGLGGVSDETLNRLYEVVRLILGSFFQ